MKISLFFVFYKPFYKPTPKNVLPKPPKAITASIMIKKKLFSMPFVTQDANSINRSSKSKKEFESNAPNIFPDIITPPLYPCNKC